jgi:hypothetical protein
MTELVMDHSTIRHIKSQAKRLKKTNQTLTYCQCLNVVAQKFGVRDFHALQAMLQQIEVTAKKSTHSTDFRLPNEFRANDWPYFDLPKFFEPITRV